MRVISDLLIDGAASPMYKALIESKLGSDFAPSTGYNPYAYTTSQSFGVQGVAAGDVDKVFLAFYVGGGSYYGMFT